MIRRIPSFLTILMILSVLATLPTSTGAPTLESLVPRNFEVNAMLVGSEGHVAAGTFYAMDPSVVPWNMSKSIYQNVGVTVIASNVNATNLSDLLGINIPSPIVRSLPVKVLIIIHGPQRNAPSIVSDIETVFGMSSGSFTALASNPLTLPVSVFAGNLNRTGYSTFIAKFAEKTSTKSIVAGRYTPSLIQSSPSGIFFTSVISLAIPLGGILPIQSSGYASMLSTSYGLPFGLNSTGVVLVRPNLLDLSQPRDHSLTFGNVVGFGSGLTSTTNETFVAILPGGAAVNSFSPSNMIVQSSPQSGGPQFTVVAGFFPWVGSVQRLLPDVTVDFHYPAFDGPALDLAWTATPFNVGGNFTLTVTLRNIGGMEARKVHVSFNVAAAILRNAPYGGRPDYTIDSLPAGSSNTTRFDYVAYSPESVFSISATFKDPADFAYNWGTFFTVAANVKENGPLTVQKSITPSSPAYGETGNVTVTVSNPSGQSFYNVLVASPEAIPWLYSGGIGGPPAEQLPCPYINFVYANSTHFTFQVSSYCSGSKAILTSIYVQPGSASSMQLVDQVRLPIGGAWLPLYPYRYPGGQMLNFNDTVTLQLNFENAGTPPPYQTGISFGSLDYYRGNPRAAYLSTGCNPCSISQAGTTTITGILANATGDPVSGATVQLSYWDQRDQVRRPLVTVATVNGVYTYNWTTSLAPGVYTIRADFSGTSQKDPDYAETTLRVMTQTVLGPGGTLTLSYPYFFNTTGTLTIGPERVVYSSIERLPSTGDFVIGEYLALSNNVTVTVGAPVIFPVLETRMNGTRFDDVYLARNQTDVLITLRLKNSGQGEATNLQVVSVIPRQLYCSSYYCSPLPVVSSSPGLTVNSTGGFVSFSIPSLQPGQETSESYVVKAASVNTYSSYANVTGQSTSGRRFKFIWDAPLLVVYPDFSIQPVPDRGYMEIFMTADPPLVANGTATTVSVHLFNAGNVTYNSVNVTIPNSSSSDFTVAVPTTRIVPSLAPGVYQSLTFVATAKANVTFCLCQPTRYSGVIVHISYNRTSTVGWSSQLYTPITIYNSRSGVTPTLRVTLSALTPVTAGSTDYVVVTVSNTGNANITNLYLNLRALSPLFSPGGSMSPETSYGSYYMSWNDVIRPGENLKFRVGIRTRAGGTYPVFVDYGGFSYSTASFSGYVSSLRGSTWAVFTATDSAGPTVSIPWKTPFAPASTDTVQVWSHIFDGSGIQTATLEYSVDNKTSWTSVAMTPLIGSYIPSSQILPVQSIFGDIYNGTIPAFAGDTAVYYRIRTADRLGNTFVEDSGGIGYQYTVQGSRSKLIVVQPGQNVQLDISQQIPSLRATIKLNVTVPVEIQVTQLTSNPAGTPPSGTAALGIYLQINTNETVTLDARIRLYYTDSQVQNLNESTIAPYFWNGLQWVSLEDVTRNTSENWVEGTVHHFSFFGIFASALSTPPPQLPKPADNLLLLILTGSIVAVAVAGSSVLLLRRRRRQEPATTPGAPPSSPTIPTPP